MAVTPRLPQVVRLQRKVKKQPSPKLRGLHPARPPPRQLVLLKHRNLPGLMCSDLALVIIVTDPSGVVYGTLRCQHQIFAVVFHLAHCFVMLRAKGRNQEGRFSSIG